MANNAITQMLSAELAALNGSVNSLRSSFKNFPTEFSKFAKNFETFLHHYLKSNQGGKGGAGGGGGGGGAGGGGGGGDDFEESGLAKAMQLYSYQLIENIKSMDNLQGRAMATNTLLQDLNIPQLGARFSKIATEVLALREEGFTKLNTSTMKLISTMKMTNQNTASLNKFLSRTSLSVNANSEEIQDLSDRLADTSRMYGMSQDKMFQIANTLSQSLKIPTLLGRGKETLEAFSIIGAKIGDRATESLKVVAEFLTGVGHETAQMAGQVFDISNNLLRQNAETQANMTEEAIHRFVAAWNQATAVFRTGGPTDKRQIAAIAEQQFGGMANVQAFLEANRALTEQAQATNTNNQKLSRFADAQEAYADVMERSALALESIALSLPKEGVQTAGKIGGGLATIAGGIGMSLIAKRALATIGADVAAGVVGGPVGMIIGGVLGVGSVIMGISDIMGAIESHTKETKTNTKDTVKALDPNKPENRTTQQGMTLFDILSDMTKIIGPESDKYSERSLELQGQVVERLTFLADRLKNVIDTPAKAQEASISR